MILIKYDGALGAATAAAGLNYFGSDGADTMNGTSASEAFWGGGGDLMTGGAGDDTYYLKSATDRVVELAGGGVDRIVAWTSVNLGDHLQVENLTVGGDGTYGAGNALDNIIEGQAGAQQLYGGLGQDILIGGAGRDVFIVVKGEGADVIQDFEFGSDKVRLKAGLTAFDQVKAHMTQVGVDVKLDLGDGDALLFRNATVGQFSATDFQLELSPDALGAKTFEDEFSGPLSIWDAQSNPTGVWRPDFGYQSEQGVGSYTLVSNDEKQIYTSPYFRGHDGDFAESPFVSNPDGTLSIWARPSTSHELFGHDYTSGLITTKESFSQTYGYFEMRADLPDAAGAWPAFWLIPTDGSWPPELDVMETLTSDPNGLWTTQHSGLGNGGHTAQGQLSFVPDTASGFHTYGALWGPSEIVWYVDNVEIFRTATPADMNKPMFMLANLALGGWGGAIDASSLPAELKIDYIRAYSLGDLQAPAPSAPAPTPTPPADAPPVVVAPPPAETPTTGVSTTSSTWGQDLKGGAGADTLTGGVGGEQMTGGAGADRFVFGHAAVSHADIRDFEVGVDKLDISGLLNWYSGSDPVADGRVILLDDGAGGTKVLVDLDGDGGAWPVYVAQLHGVPVAGLTAETLLSVGQPAAAGLSLGTGRYADTLAGGSGADTLNAGLGPDQLTGGAGADHFVFDETPWEASSVRDFTPGVDKLDVSGLLHGVGYAGSDPIGDTYIKLIANGDGGTWVYFDRDGAAPGDQWGTFVTTLESVSPNALHASDWIF